MHMQLFKEATEQDFPQPLMRLIKAIGPRCDVTIRRYDNVDKPHEDWTADFKIGDYYVQCQYHTRLDIPRFGVRINSRAIESIAIMTLTPEEIAEVVRERLRQAERSRHELAMRALLPPVRRGKRLLSRCGARVRSTSAL
jgi:hypothetical protein